MVLKELKGQDGTEGVKGSHRTKEDKSTDLAYLIQLYHIYPLNGNLKKLSRTPWLRFGSENQ